MSYGSAYHNGADCELCGVRVTWDSMRTHREWHLTQEATISLMGVKIRSVQRAIIDLIQVIWKDHPVVIAEITRDLEKQWGLSNSEGVSSE